MTKGQRTILEGIITDLEGIASDLHDSCEEHKAAQNDEQRSEAVELVLEALGELAVSAAGAARLRADIEASNG